MERDQEELRNPSTADLADRETDDTDEGREDLTQSDAGPALFEMGQMERFQTEWEAIQTGFVDEPREAVERRTRWWQT